MLVLVYGTRPEAIKLEPVASALMDKGVPFVTICTGQHTDLLAELPMAALLSNSIDLHLPSSGNVAEWLRSAKPALCAELGRVSASIVVVQGDTMSALAGARAADTHGLSLCHVEAGIRSGNLNEPWPEEGFRREITKLTSYHYAPTTTAYANLMSEGIAQRCITLTGNTVVTALANSGARLLAPEPYLLMTMHRREWVRDVDMAEWARALARAAARHPELTIIWPMHPAVVLKWGAEGQGESLSSQYSAIAGHLGVGLPANISIIAPLPYKQVARVLSAAKGLISDSGGLVEEAATLGVPTAILRRWNDRPEAVEAGIARQFEPDAGGLEAAVEMLARGDLPRRPTSVYGAADSAEAIARHLERLYTLTEEEILP